MVFVVIICLTYSSSQYPERVFHASSTVTSVDFSHLHPNLLAVSTPLLHYWKGRELVYVAGYM